MWGWKSRSWRVCVCGLSQVEHLLAESIIVRVERLSRALTDASEGIVFFENVFRGVTKVDAFLNEESFEQSEFGVCG